MLESAKFTLADGSREMTDSGSRATDVSLDGQPAERSRLKSGQLGSASLLVLALALVGPGAGAFFNLSTLGAVAGPALVLALLLSWVAMLTMVNTVAQFAGRVPSAGLFYTFVSQGLGPQAGFVAGWILMADYGAVTAFALVYPADQVSSYLNTTFGVNVPWWLIFLVALGAVGWLAFRGIRPSLRTDIIFLIYELGALLALALTVLFKLGPAHWTAAPFTPGSAGWHGVRLAWILGITAFLGFEGAVTGSEESSVPRQRLPKVLYMAVILAGVYFIITGYAGVLGYGTHAMGSIASNPLPWNTVADRYWGSGLGLTVDVGAWVSMFAVGLASMNASARLWFSMGREHVLPPVLGEVATRRAVPSAALLLQVALTVAIGLGLGFWLGPFPSFLFLATVLSVGALIAYIMASVALPVFMLRRQRESFRVVTHLLLPAVAIVIVAFPLYSSVWPLPPSPFDYAVYSVAAWILIGLVLLARLAWRKPEALQKAGRLWSSE
jgi:amino acid transporter